MYHGLFWQTAAKQHTTQHAKGDVVLLNVGGAGGVASLAPSRTSTFRPHRTRWGPQSFFASGDCEMNGQLLEQVTSAVSNAVTAKLRRYNSMGRLSYAHVWSDASYAVYNHAHRSVETGESVADLLNFCGVGQEVQRVLDAYEARRNRGRSTRRQMSRRGSSAVRPMGGARRDVGDDASKIVDIVADAIVAYLEENETVSSISRLTVDSSGVWSLADGDLGETSNGGGSLCSLRQPLGLDDRLVEEFEDLFDAPPQTIQQDGRTYVLQS